jgi:hypothetical protein
MAQMAAQHAIAQLNRDVAFAISNSISISTMPGAVYNSGNLILLSSASLPEASSNSTNANFISSMSGYGVIHSNTNTNLFLVPIVNLTNSMGGTNIYGRYSYWVDDDGSRANLNAMVQSSTVSNRTNYIPGFPTNSNPRILDPSVFISAAGSGNSIGDRIVSQIRRSFASPSPTNSWSYFFTPRQILSTNHGFTLANSRQMLTQVTAGPANLGDIWHYTNSAIATNKINLNQNLPSVEIGGINLQRNFLTNAALSTALTSELDSLINYKIDRALFDDLVETLEIGSLCALGGGLPLGVKNALQYFRGELDGYFEG